jgi:8-oxo-dGTP pyrophosphatase MutT (NUDIX family)
MEIWKVLASKIAFDTKWFKVQQDTVQLPNGKIMNDYYMWLQGDVTKIVPIISDNHFILVRHYRHALGTFSIQFPGGIAGKEEEALRNAEKELYEETGYTCERLEKLATWYENPTKTKGTMHVYLAQNVIEKGTVHAGPEEEIEVLKKSFDEVIEMIEKGEIFETTTVAATFLALKKIGYLKTK